MERLIPDLVAASIRRPWATIAAALLLTALTLMLVAATFRMTTDTGELISPDVDWRRQERAMKDAFPQLRDVLLIVVDGATPEAAEDGAARLAGRLRDDRAHVQLVRRPDGGDFFARTGLLYGSTREVGEATAALIAAQPLLGPLAADPSLRGVAGAVTTMADGVARGETSLNRVAKPLAAMAGAIDARLAGRPAFFSWQALFAGDAGVLDAPRRRLILVRPVMDYGSLTPGARAADAVRAHAAALGLDAAHGVRVRLTGDVALTDEEFASLEENIGFVGLVMLAAMLATLWLATRSARQVGGITLTIVAGLVVTTAAGLLAVGRLNLISVAFIPLFVGLGVDFGIQICVRFNAERHAGHPADEAIARAAAALGAPLLLAAGAVFLGFGAFLPTAYVGIAELGVIAGIGMVVALLLSVTMLPALLMVMRSGPPAREVGFAWAAPVDRWLERRRRWVLGAFVAAMLASIAGLPHVRFDFNPMHLRDPGGPAMATLADLTRDAARTPNTIGILARDARAAAALAARLRPLPEVARVVTLDSFVPADQVPKLAAIGDAAMLLDLTLNPFDVMPAPDDAARVAALLPAAARLRQVSAGRAGAGAHAARTLAAAFERLARARPPMRGAVEAMLARPLATMLDQARAALQAQPVSAASLPPELVRDWRTPDGRYRIEVFPGGDADDNAVMERFRTAVTAIAPEASGLPVATQRAAFTVAGAFVQAGVIAFILVSLLLLAVLRNVREVAFTLAPVILSIFLTLGTCVAIGQPINFANIIAFPLLFGVGVAFHIYFVMAWRAGTRDLLQSPLARAVLFSAFATGTAFGSLWLSTHPGTASMGKILMISLAWTLICALIFEPALLGPPVRGRERG